MAKRAGIPKDDVMRTLVSIEKNAKAPAAPASQPNPITVEQIKVATPEEFKKIDVTNLNDQQFTAYGIRLAELEAK